MACSTLIRSNTLQDSFTSIFPDCTTLQGSSAFMKKLTAVSCSFMTYMRGVFPPEAYKELKFLGLPLKVLNVNCGIDSVEKFVNYIRNCYDAIDKKYLQQISIGIGVDPNDKDTVVEAYNIKFKYTKEEEYAVIINDQVTMSSKSNLIDATAKATYVMMENIMKCSQSLDDLPSQKYIFIRLLYFDDVTPRDYEPIGFMPCQKPKFSFATSPENILIGSANTPFERSSFLLKTTLYNPFRSQRKEVSEDPIVTPNHAPKNKAKDIRKKVQSEHDDNIDDDNSLIPETDLSPDCPCGFGVVDESTAINCHNCGRKQHMSCYGILNPNCTPQSFYCLRCFPLQALNDDKVPDSIYNCPRENVEILCILRRGFELCQSKRNLSFKEFMKHYQCEKKTAVELIELLEHKKFIKKGARNEYIVEEKVIQDKEFIQQYFPMLEMLETDDEIMDKENVDDLDVLFTPNIQRPQQRVYFSPNEASEELVFASASNRGTTASTEMVDELSMSIKESFQGMSSAKSKPKQTRKRSIAKQSLPSDDSASLFESSQTRKRARIARKK